MAWNQAEIDICQEALMILRQDIDLPTPATADADNTLEWKKCKLVFKRAVNEVYDAFEWSADIDVEKVLAWPQKLKNALVYCLARELAVPIAGRVADMRDCDALYRDKLLQAKMEVLNLNLSINDDPILTELVGNFRMDDPGLVNVYEIYTRRVENVKSESDKEVKSTLGLDKLDDLATSIATCLSVAKLAVACGLDANYKQLKLQEYQSKLQEYRKVRLNRALQENDDPVLGEILANFRSDDAALVNAFEIYTKRSDLVKTVAVQEINIAHEWSEGKFTSEVTTHVAYPAYLALCAAKLVIACGLTGDAAKLYEARYQAKLREARVKDLEDTEIEDSVTKDVFALIRGNFAEDAALPRSIAALTKKIETLVPMARREVLSSHDWSFALKEIVSPAYSEISSDPIYHYQVTLPEDCLLVSAVYNYSGRVTQWKRMKDGVCAAECISRLVYLQDVEDVKEYPAKVYRAFILRLVADLSKSLASSPKDRQYQEQLARDALNDAKMCDSRDSNTPDEAWGQNELADKMIWGSDDPLDRS